jgi:hypothetical protein
MQLLSMNSRSGASPAPASGLKMLSRMRNARFAPLDVFVGRAALDDLTGQRACSCTIEKVSIGSQCYVDVESTRQLSSGTCARSNMP